MWIRELAVDDFGHLHKVSVGGLSGGMNVVLGPNESGKTTLLHFLRWVLFGFPHGNTDAVRRYRPPSGHFGGRLRVERDRSAREPNAPAPTSMLLERHYGDEDPLITTADGATAPPGTLFELVGSAGLELFETVFAITTDELSDFQGLDTHEVREQIYAAGIVGRGRSARRVIESLEQRRHALLGPRSGRIRELHRELQRRREELAGATTAAEGLPARRDELDRLGRDVAAADARRLALLARCEQLAKVIAIWPHWLAAESAREELVSLGPELELPADPRGTLEALRERLDEATAALEQAEADLERTERRVEQVEVDDRLAALAPRIRDLDRLSTLAEQRDGRIATLRVQVQDLRSRRDEQLADLGPGWTPRGALAVDVSMPRVGAVRELASACTEVDRELRATRAELEEARRTHDILSAEVGTLEATSLEVRSRLGTELDTNSALAASLQLQGLLAELGRAESAASGDARYAELVRELTEGGHRAAVPRLLFPALVATSAACAGGSAIAFLVESPIAAILLAAAAVASLVLALVARSGPRPRALRAPELHTDDAGADRLRQLRHRVATLSAACGLPRLPSAEQVAERRGELERLTRCETDLAAHRARLASLSDAVQSARSRHDAARDELLALERSWAELRGAIGLPEQVQLAEAVALLDRLRTARNTARDLEGRASELGELEAAQRRYAEEVAELMEAAGLDGANATGGAGIALLAEGLRGDEKDRRRLRELQRQRAEAAEQLERALRRRDADAGRLAELHASTGTESEDDYLALVEQEARRAALTGELDRFEQRLRAVFGQDSALRDALSRLRSGNLAAWEGELRELRAEAEEAARAHEQAVRTHQDARKEVERLEASAEVAALTLAVEALRSELADALEDWTVATIAQEGITETLRSFESERQPEVVRAAADSFARVTDRRYVALLPQEGSMKVELADGSRLDAGQLSRGTTEQLYLAMRFGLALSHANTNPLPLVLDDVLINADPQRRRALAAELHSVAARLQVLLFTCHPATAELVRSSGPTTVVGMPVP